MLTHPPLQYVFFDFEQPEVAVWDSLEKFIHDWNEKSGSSFVSEQPGEWFITLNGGINDPELLSLQQALKKLNAEIGLTWFVGIKDERRPEEFESSPYIKVMGLEYPPSFIVNSQTAFGEEKHCGECGKSDISDKKVKKQLIIDESRLLKQMNIDKEDNSFRVDFVSLPNMGFMISRRVFEVLEQKNIKGYKALPVISKETGEPSQRFFLFRAEKSFIKPCGEHTKVTESGICSTCGRILGGLLTYYTVRESWLGDDDVFSTHPCCYAKIYFTNKLYHLLKKTGVNGMTPAYGIFNCGH